MRAAELLNGSIGTPRQFQGDVNPTPLVLDTAIRLHFALT